MNKRSLVENKTLQKEFLHRLSSTLRNFKWKTNGANFSCPICGDSKKNETKARGYIFEKENLYQYFCHNCGFSSNFSFFLKSVNSLLHTEYLKELFLDKKRTDVIMSSVRPKLLPNRISLTYVKAPTIDSLDEGHIAKEYVKRRKIPNKYLKELFYVSTFGNWVRKHLL